MTKVGLLQVKQALNDPRFRDALPRTLQDDVVQFLEDPGCACNVSFYRKILRDHKELLKKYYPGQEVTEESEDIARLAANTWTVINCHIDELEDKLRKLPSGRKQLEVARFEDQVTVVINELDVIY